MKEPLFTEAIKLKDGEFFNLPYHQRRMMRTATHFFPRTESSELVIPESVIREKHPSGLYKCRIVYSDRIRKVEVTPYTVAHPRRVKLVIADHIDYSFKHEDRSALRELLKQAGCDDIIIVRKGMITDSFAANLVFSSPEGLFTPATPLLAGTKRQQLLDSNIIHERIITPEDMFRYQSVNWISAMLDPADGVSIPVTDIII